MDQEAASRVAVFRRQSELYDRSQSTASGQGVWIESALGASQRIWARSEHVDMNLHTGCLSNNLLGQQQRSGQGKACRYAESVDQEACSQASWDYEFLRTDVDPAGGSIDRAADKFFRRREFGFIERVMVLTKVLAL